VFRAVRDLVLGATRHDLPRLAGLDAVEEVEEVVRAAISKLRL
jgi:hypothetical protein